VPCCEPSVGSVVDACENALAGTVIAPFKPEVIHHRGPRRYPKAVEHATLACIDRCNQSPLPEPIGFVPPARLERA
jgi:hypothetical protein